MKPFIALLGALLAGGALPALAAPTLAIPVASTAPSMSPNADITAFNPAAIAQLTWNAARAKDAGQETSAMLTTDGKNLYVRFDASQSQRIVSAPFVDGTSRGDTVAVELWPAGASGPAYTFAAAPDGTPGARASSGPAPAFSSGGTTFPGGYTVTMTIPLAQLHGVAASDWKVQLVRTIASTGARYVWSHAASAPTDDALAQAGTMTLPAAVGKN